MSSTNNFSGIQNDSRSSSRVLKPPGGGHSDIFGIHDSSSVKLPQTPRSNVPKSTIQEVLCDNVDSKKPLEKKEIDIDDSDKVQNGDKGEENKAPPQTPQRTRVPPGGFSSGLW